MGKKNTAPPQAPSEKQADSSCAAGSATPAQELPSDPDEKRKAIAERVAAARAQQQSTATQAASAKCSTRYAKGKDLSVATTQQLPGRPAEGHRLLQIDPLFVAKSSLHGWG